jgi:hypothetical protein
MRDTEMAGVRLIACYGDWSEVDIVTGRAGPNAGSSKSGNSMFHSSNPTLFGRTGGVLGESEVLSRTVGGLRRVYVAQLGLSIDGVLDGFEAHERSECELLQRFFLAAGKQTDDRSDAS